MKTRTKRKLDRTGAVKTTVRGNKSFPENNNKTDEISLFISLRVCWFIDRGYCFNIVIVNIMPLEMLEKEN